MNAVPTTALSTEVVPLAQMERMAAAIAKSGLFGVKTADQALSLMLIAQAEGLHPALAARDYHVIQGRPALKADAMLARYQAAGGRVEWKEHTDTRVIGVFTHPAGGAVTIDWTMDRAKAAGLTAKDNWKHYPRQMLRARVISEGIRATFPGVVVGTYTPEEVQDMEPARDVTPERATVEEAVREVARPATALTDDEITEHLDAILNAEGAEALRSAYVAACEHANQARDKASKERFIAAYNERKTVLV